jgi:hypothetical protein
MPVVYDWTSGQYIDVPDEGDSGGGYSGYTPPPPVDPQQALLDQLNAVNPGRVIGPDGNPVNPTLNNQWRDQPIDERYAPTPYEGDRGLSYWVSQGFDPERDMFDSNGQLLPEWEHTADGYSFRGRSNPTVSARNLFPAPNLPNPSSYPAPNPLQPWTEEWVEPNPGELANDAGFKFRLGEGIKALQRSAASKGTLLTGGTLKDLTKYGQDYSSNEYRNFYDRRYNDYDTRRTNFLTNEANRYTSERGNRMDNWGIDSDHFNMGRVNRLDDFNIWDRLDTGYWNQRMDLARLAQPRNPY